MWASSFREKGAWVVHEAVGPVKATPLDGWIAQGEGGAYMAKRLAGDKAPDDAAVGKLKASAKRFMGLPCDWKFLWDDERIYCSELVWKVYAEGLGVELCAPKPMRAHHLGHPVVRRTMAERYGDTPPLDEPMVAPSTLFTCPLLATVWRTP